MLVGRQAPATGKLIPCAVGTGGGVGSGVGVGAGVGVGDGEAVAKGVGAADGDGSGVVGAGLAPWLESQAASTTTATVAIIANTAVPLRVNLNQLLLLDRIAFLGHGRFDSSYLYNGRVVLASNSLASGVALDELHTGELRYCFANAGDAVVAGDVGGLQGKALQ